VITEIVEFQVKPGTAEDFIAGVKSSQPISSDLRVSLA
jgi:hypothetical protein